MADNPNVIREFLVALGFKIDEAGAKKFVEGVKSMTQTALALGSAVQVMAATVTAATARLSREMEAMAYSSDRLGSSAGKIKGISYAVEQVGGSASGARQSMENLARFMRDNPGGKGVLQHFLGSGVNLNDTAATFKALGEKFRTMPYANARAFAERFGIDESTFQAMLEPLDKYIAEYNSKLRKLGLDPDEAGRSAKEFMGHWRSMGESISVITDKIVHSLNKELGPQIKQFTEFLDEHGSKIARVVSDIAKGVLDMSRMILDAIVNFNDLDPAVKAAMIMIGGLAGAVWLLSSPIRLLALAAAGLVTLYQDYKRWKETGEVGLVDWAKWEPTIQKLKDTLATVSDWLKKLGGDEIGGIGALQIAFTGFAAYVAGKWVTDILGAFLKVGAGATDLARGGGGRMGLLGLFGGLARAGGVALGAFAGYDSYKLATDEEYRQQSTDKIQQRIDEGKAAEKSAWNASPAGRAWNWAKGKLGFGEGGGKPASGGEGGDNRTWWQRNAPSWLGGKERGEGAGTSPAVDASGYVPFSGVETPEQKALLATIASSESPAYNVMYGGRRFSSYADHPRVDVPIRRGPNAGRTSSAAGLFQMLKGTWDGAANALGLKEFTPPNQDKAAWYLARTRYKRATGRNLHDDLRSGDPETIAGIGRALRGEWTSLPGGIEQGQNAQTLIRRYNKYLEKFQREHQQKIDAQPQPEQQSKPHATLLDAVRQASQALAGYAESGGLARANDNIAAMMDARPLTPDPSVFNRSTVMNYNPKTDVNITGMSDAREAAEQFAGVQMRVNQGFLRNVASAVR
ncbi:hypothetical protein [Pseudochelatococcus contaminans]|uniref:Muramidase (Phage lysozyme) n=1 Tax=Pseudochelatococcus contaminans TaxID=1538103 RepID=A0A7W5Z278_9HYPH|nr:hypothetical protein [Pseudochelatococcus contaminans]MBB3808748.1 muramidase (phage lysozyme) [Pseudochelatococcus contaminans]